MPPHFEKAVQMKKGNPLLSVAFQAWGAVTKDQGQANVGFVALDTGVCKTEDFPSAGHGTLNSRGQ